MKSNWPEYVMSRVKVMIISVSEDVKIFLLTCVVNTVLSMICILQFIFKKCLTLVFMIEVTF